MKVPASMVFLGLIALLCIGAGIGLVIVSSESKHVLVRDDYYRDGLKLDAYRAREAAFDSLGISLTLREEGRALVVEAQPKGEGGVTSDAAAVRQRLDSLTLSLELRRPDDGSLDRDLKLTLASSAPRLWAVDAEPLRRGRWNVRAVFFDKDGKPVMEESFAFDAAGNAK